MEHKKIQGKKGLTWLFYGCRHKNGDFLFQKELDEYLKCQVLNKLDVAFSRDPNQDAKYVQVKLKSNLSKEFVYILSFDNKCYRKFSN